MKMKASTLDMYLNKSDGREWWINTECEEDSKEDAMTSKDFNQIKDWFVNGFWSEKRVRDAVKMGKITQEECDIILSIKD